MKTIQFASDKSEEPTNVVVPRSRRPAVLRTFFVDGSHPPNNIHVWCVLYRPDTPQRIVCIRTEIEKRNTRMTSLQRRRNWQLHQTIQHEQIYNNGFEKDRLTLHFCVFGRGSTVYFSYRMFQSTYVQHYFDRHIRTLTLTLRCDITVCFDIYII